MWYFAWILGVTAALAFGVINVMWYEFQNEFEHEEVAPAAAPMAIRKVHG
jgi:cyd operon protein YbgT